MAKKAKKAAPRRRKITLIESEESATATRAKLKAPRGKTPVQVDLFVRAPDKMTERSLAVTARLCACRRVCIAFV